MILFALPPHTVETVPAWNGAPLRSWRWAVCADRGSFGVEEQMRATGEWHGVGRYACVGFSSTRPKSGFYQGDHEHRIHSCLWLGPFYLNWSLDWWTEVFAPAEDDQGSAVASFIGAVLLAAMGVSP